MMLSEVYHTYPIKEGQLVQTLLFDAEPDMLNASLAKDTVAEVLCEDCCALGFVQCTFRMGSTLRKRVT